MSTKALQRLYSTFVDAEHEARNREHDHRTSGRTREAERMRGTADAFTVAIAYVRRERARLRYERSVIEGTEVLTQEVEDFLADEG